MFWCFFLSSVTRCPSATAGTAMTTRSTNAATTLRSVRTRIPSTIPSFVPGCTLHRWMNAPGYCRLPSRGLRDRGPCLSDPRIARLWGQYEGEFGAELRIRAIGRTPHRADDRGQPRRDGGPLPRHPGFGLAPSTNSLDLPGVLGRRRRRSGNSSRPGGRRRRSGRDLGPQLRRVGRHPVRHRQGWGDSGQHQPGLSHPRIAVRPRPVGGQRPRQRRGVQVVSVTSR